MSVLSPIELGSPAVVRVADEVVVVAQRDAEAAVTVVQPGLARGVMDEDELDGGGRRRRVHGRAGRQRARGRDGEHQDDSGEADAEQARAPQPREAGAHAGGSGGSWLLLCRGGRMSLERPNREDHEAGPAISVVRPGNAGALSWAPVGRPCGASAEIPYRSPSDTEGPLAGW